MKEQQTLTVEQLLIKHFPVELKEFAHAPWDYAVFGPMSLDDLAIIKVVLYIGKHKKMLTLTFDMHITDVRVEQTHINSPKIKS